MPSVTKKVEKIEKQVNDLVESLADYLGYTVRKIESIDRIELIEEENGIPVDFRVVSVAELLEMVNNDTVLEFDRFN